MLGQLRNDLGRPPVYEGPYRYVWVVDFPMFVGVSEDGHPKPAHHPFTRPHPDDIDRLETDPMSVRSRAYDLVLNGWELGSGSIRIHEPELQQRIFDLLGIDEEEAQPRFGFFLTPFRYGAPPARRLRVRPRPARRDPRGRGEHPRGDRVPEDAVRRRSDDGLADPRRCEAARHRSGCARCRHRPDRPPRSQSRQPSDLTVYATQNGVGRVAAMRALRTPDDRFENLPGWTFAPKYTEVPDGEGGTLRVHHVDEGPPARTRSCACTASRRGRTCTGR